MKRYLLGAALGLALGFSGPADAGLAILNGGGTGGLFAQGSCAASGGTTCSSAATTVDIPAGSLVVIAASFHLTSGTMNAAADSAGNGYSVAGANFPASGFGIVTRQFYAITASDLPIGSTFTITYSNTLGVKAVMVAAFSGAAGSPYDSGGLATNNGTGTGSVSAGPTGTLSCPGGGVNCEVIIKDLSFNNSGTVTEDAGFTSLGQVTTNSFTQMGYKIVSATTAVSNTSILSGASGTWAMNLQGFTAASGSCKPSLSSQGAGAC